MAGYDFFSQPNGPSVDVNLFGNAGAQGAQIGKATPTLLTSAIEGVTKGVETGLDIYGKYQQNEARGLEIEAKELQLQRDRQNQELQLQDDTAKLKNDVSKQQEELNLREQSSQFSNEFSALQGNPQAQADLVLGGKYGGVLSKNQELYKQSLQQVYPALPPDKQAAVDKFFAKSSTSSFYEKEAYKRQQKFEEARSAALNDSLTAELSARGDLQVPPEQYPSQGMFKPSGAYVKDPSTGAIAIDPVTHQWQVNKAFDPKAASTYDFISPDGRVLSENVAASSKKSYESAHLEKGYQDGRFKDTAVNNAVTAVDSNSPSKKNTPTAPPVNPFSYKKTSTLDPFTESVKTSLRLSDSQVTKLSSPIKSLEGIVINYANDAAARNDPSTISNITHVSQTIAKSISDDQFDSSESIQAQYTPAMVEQYNKGLRDNLLSATQGANSSKATAELAAIYEAAKIHTPKDLFYLKNGSYLDNKVNSFIYKTAAQVSSKQNSVFNNQAASQANINNISAIANGR